MLAKMGWLVQLWAVEQNIYILVDCEIMSDNILAIYLRIWFLIACKIMWYLCYFLSPIHPLVSFFFQTFLEQSFHLQKQQTYSNMLVNWRRLSSHHMILAAETVILLSLQQKTGLKTKTDRWGGSCSDKLWLLSAPRGTIRRASALPTIPWPTNRLFPYLHYGIIGVVREGHRQYFYRSGLHPPGLEKDLEASNLFNYKWAFSWHIDPPLKKKKKYFKVLHNFNI